MVRTLAEEEGEPVLRIGVIRSPGTIPHLKRASMTDGIGLLFDQIIRLQADQFDIDAKYLLPFSGDGGHSVCTRFVSNTIGQTDRRQFTHTPIASFLQTLLQKLLSLCLIA